jgi:DNA (cytosine-5)-methyltransferase 1
VRRLQRLGYQVDWRVLSACDYGAPTTRRRLYVVARRDGRLPQWTAPTHGPGRAHPWRAAAEVIDWSIPCPSIFDRDRPLAEATLARIARGIQRFVLDDPNPFVVGDMVPSLIHVSNGERPGQTPRTYDIRHPLGTVVAGGVKQGLVVAYLARHFGGRGTVGSSMREPLRTVTAQDHHALVTAFLARYQGTGEPESVRRPLGTLTARDRYGLVTVEIGAATWTIRDICMRLLTPRELARAQGFPDDYVIETGTDGERITRTDQVRLIGNSVCPPVAKAIVEANR